MVVDLGEVTLLSAGGVALLVEAAQRLRASGRVLQVRNATGIVDRVLDVLGVYPVLDGIRAPGRAAAN